MKEGIAAEANPKNQSQYTYVIDQIKKMILTGKLTIGDRLPPERDLAQKYNVSRNSVREAMRTLQAIGLLDCRQGSGNYIVNNLKEQLSDSFSLIFMLDRCSMTDLTSLRRTFEAETLRGIVWKDDPNIWKRFENLAHKIRISKSIDEIEALDVEFHMLVASLATNPMIQYLQMSINTAYQQNVEFLNVTYPRWSINTLEHAQQYQLDIVNALLSKDIPTIERALYKHYSYIKDYDLDIETLYEEYLRKGSPKPNGQKASPSE